MSCVGEIRIIVIVKYFMTKCKSKQNIIIIKKKKEHCKYLINKMSKKSFIYTYFIYCLHFVVEKNIFFVVKVWKCFCFFK